jgi:hypothetical protein
VDLIGHGSRPDLIVEDREKGHVVYHDDGEKWMKWERPGKDKFRVGRVVNKIELYD